MISPDLLRTPGATWPWNIKPALLVLWGVCWMFIYPDLGYPPPGSYFDIPSLKGQHSRNLLHLHSNVIRPGLGYVYIHPSAYVTTSGPDFQPVK
jgi:hypothetical protein